jgi:predicted glutamine amidotransferase
MCELLAMSARFPTTIRLSMSELASHGGRTGPHRDGWGVGFVQAGDAFVLREPEAASESQWLSFLQTHSLRSELVLAHIRRATRGERLLRNSQPFARELGGRMHLFAHNGTLAGIDEDERLAARRFRPIGDTDSERAFCALLERLEPLWQQGPPSLDERLAAVVSFAADLRRLGPANFVYSDTDAIFAHAHRRTQQGGEIRPPGLHLLCRRCAAAGDDVELAGVTSADGPLQHVALVASVPLSSERWEAVPEGAVVVLRGGQVAAIEHAR